MPTTAATGRAGSRATGRPRAARRTRPAAGPGRAAPRPRRSLRSTRPTAGTGRGRTADPAAPPVERWCPGRSARTRRRPAAPATTGRPAGRPGRERARPGRWPTPETSSGCAMSGGTRSGGRGQEPGVSPAPSCPIRRATRTDAQLPFGPTCRWLETADLPLSTGLLGVRPGWTGVNLSGGSPGAVNRPLTCMFDAFCLVRGGARNLCRSGLDFRPFRGLTPAVHPPR